MKAATPVPSGDAAKLAEILQDAVAMLRDAEVLDREPPLPARMEPSLLQQCLDLCRGGVERAVEPVRTVHHFACSGGTLISKCIAAMPNVQLLSEVDPLSRHARSATPIFAPTDMLLAARQGTRPAEQQAQVDLFLAGLQVLHQQTRERGGYLVLRDHSHSHFCSDPDPDPSHRPTLREIVATRHRTLSVVTVRHPAHSFRSLQAHGWITFHPPTLDEYSRRYLDFLARYRDCPVVRYEAFVRDPRGAMQAICAGLELPYVDGFERLFPVFRLTGDSGRGGNRIAPRADRPLDDALRAEMAASANYARLVEQLGYDSGGKIDG